MIRPDRARVIVIRPSAVARRRARREIAALVDSALSDLAAVQAGELVHVHGAYLDLGRAVALVLHHGIDAEELAC